jgi:hypothetical protein
VRFSPVVADHMAYSVSDPKASSVHVVDLATGKASATKLSAGFQILAVALNTRADSAYFIARLPQQGAAPGVWRISTSDGRAEQIIAGGPADAWSADDVDRRVALTPDGKRLAVTDCLSGGPCRVRVVDTASLARTELSVPSRAGEVGMGVLGVLNTGIVVVSDTEDASAFALVPFAGGPARDLIEFSGTGPLERELLPMANAIVWLENEASDRHQTVAHVTDVDSGRDAVVHRANRYYEIGSTDTLALPPQAFLLVPDACFPGPDRIEVLFQWRTGRAIPTGWTASSFCNG